MSEKVTPRTMTEKRESQLRIIGPTPIELEWIMELDAERAVTRELCEALEAQRVCYGGDLGACFCPAAWLRRDHHPRCEQASAALSKARRDGEARTMPQAGGEVKP